MYFNGNLKLALLLCINISDNYLYYIFTWKFTAQRTSLSHELDDR